uniref:Uncharacterized protein n=1 Tax=Odontella aurita TaxID=265563 RepID=A0A7S4I3H3_9STRA
MSAWARSNEPHRAEMARALLEEMKELGEDDPSLRPGLYHYNWAINACTGHIALGDGDLPSVPGADASRDDESRRAFEIALETYHYVVGISDDGIDEGNGIGGGGSFLEEVGNDDEEEDVTGEGGPGGGEESRRASAGSNGRSRRGRHNSPRTLRPDSRTYAFFLKAIATNPSVRRDERAQLAERTFLRCQRAGLVSREVVQQLMRACPRPQQYMSLVGTFGRYPVDVDDLPDKWSRNNARRGG